MNICFFTSSQARTGGTERAVAKLASILAERGLRVSVLSIHEGTQSGFPVSRKVLLHELFSCESKGVFRFLESLVKLRSYVKSRQPNVLIAVESLSFLYFVALIFSKKNTKLINWEHFNVSVSLGLASRVVARWWACRRADKIVVLTDIDRRGWIRELHCDPNRIVRIYNLNPFDQLGESKFDLLTNLNSGAGKEKSRKVVLAAGRLECQKGFDLLIKAWAQIPNYLRDGWELQIVGNGSKALSLKQLTVELEVADSVMLKNATDCIEEEYKRADLFVLSSRFEGFGLVLIEAQSFDLPVVSFDCDAGPSEIISHAENGLLVEQENVPMLAQALAQLMQDDSLRLKMAANAQNYLYRFSEQVIADQWLDLLNDIGIKQN